MLGCLAIALALPFAAAASATDYPTKPIRLVLPYPPGAIGDALARTVAAELGKDLGQTIFVDNKPGGGAVIGTQATKAAPADGYTLMLNLNPLVTNLYSLKQPGYALSDFVAIGMIAESAYVLITSTKYPLTSVQGVIDFGKENPGQMNYSAVGIGGASFILETKLKEALGIDWATINYKGGAEATQAVMSGDVHFSLPTQGAPLIHSNADKLRLIAVTSDKRLDFIPDVPTFKELGYPTLKVEAWFGLFVRSQTPQPIVTKLKAAFARIYSSPEMQEKLKSLRVTPYEGSLDEVPAKLAQELVDFTAEARKRGVAPQ